MMNPKKLFLTGAIGSLMLASGAAAAKTIQFSGYTWEVRAAGSGGPGPNQWDPNNVRVDDNGWLHLRLTHTNGQWQCAEVYTQERLGLGCYQFRLAGRVDQLDKNVVFGLFNYPTDDVGPDGTHEIDIEFSKWGNPAAASGNYTVWPAKTNLRQRSETFAFTLDGEASTHRFTWSATNIFFQSRRGHVDDNRTPFASWLYQPAKPSAHIAQKPMPVHLNLWCFQGHAPSDGQPVELVIRDFKFTPL